MDGRLLSKTTISFCIFLLLATIGPNCERQLASANQISGGGGLIPPKGGKSCEEIKWQAQDEANAIRASRIQAAFQKLETYLNNCSLTWDKDVLDCRRDYSAAIYAADLKARAARWSCAADPVFWKWPSCLAKAEMQYDADRKAAEFKKLQCLDSAVDKENICRELRIGLFNGEKNEADSEREAKQRGIEIDYAACVAKRQR